VLRRIFRIKRDEVAGGWRRLHNEELHNSYDPQNIIRVIKLKMRWAEHIARMGETRNATIQGDSKLLSGFPWPIIFKPEITK
jgi:hypothetical protein